MKKIIRFCVCVLVMHFKIFSIFFFNKILSSRLTLNFQLHFHLRIDFFLFSIRLWTHYVCDKSSHVTIIYTGSSGQQVCRLIKVFQNNKNEINETPKQIQIQKKNRMGYQNKANEWVTPNVPDSFWWWPGQLNDRRWFSHRALSVIALIHRLSMVRTGIWEHVLSV